MYDIGNIGNKLQTNVDIVLRAITHILQGIT